MSSNYNDYITILKENMTAIAELQITVDDYLDEIEDIYSDVYTENIRKFLKQMLKEAEGVSKEDLHIMIKQRIDNWDDILKDELYNYSRFAMQLFRVPKNLMLPRDEKVHEAIENYSVKEDKGLDEQIELAKERIKNKKAYMSMLSLQVQKLEMQKEALAGK